MQVGHLRVAEVAGLGEWDREGGGKGRGTGGSGGEFSKGNVRRREVRGDSLGSFSLAKGVFKIAFRSLSTVVLKALQNPYKPFNSLEKAVWRPRQGPWGVGDYGKCHDFGKVGQSKIMARKLVHDQCVGGY